MSNILLPFESTQIIGKFIQRYKRFSVEIEHDGKSVWVHSNNTGSMLGLNALGTAILASLASNPKRKLKYTQECIWHNVEPNDCNNPVEYQLKQKNGFWVGVNTLVPNRLLQKAFHAKILPFTKAYSLCEMEKKYENSRIDAYFSGNDVPPLWVECKNVTLVEDDTAYFPDSKSIRGQKHLANLMDIVKSGQRAATFYLIQRPDAKCFAPADMIDKDYADLFWQAYKNGVEMYFFKAGISEQGISLLEQIPLAKDCK